MCDEWPSQSSVILTLPGEVAINLPLPSKDDSLNLDQYIIQQRTIGNELKIFRDERWPIDEIINYNFKTLTIAEKDELTELLKKSYGRKLILTDPFNSVFDVFVLNDDLTFVEERDCAFSIQLRFQKL